MIVNADDVVEIDGHWKSYLNGKTGTVIRLDYDRELALFDDGKIIIWVSSSYLKILRRFYEKCI